ncbi:hypothetical protein GQ53DRAFT_793113 [Thozetella sp. PMI_491]|nr:hypothetical protein GQ53DRAFT_793113 [Thozetella sp. PMI_491]
MGPQRTSSHTAKRPRLGGERTMLACTTCKQKKLKCDGQSPKCQNCFKSDRECLVEDPATGLQRPRDYMQSLEARVAWLEGLLQRFCPEAMAAVSDAGVENPVDMLSSEVALLCLSAAGREPHYFGPSSAVSFSRIASVTMGLRHKGGSSVRSNAGGASNPNPGMRRDLQEVFPAPAVAVRLGQAYWNNIHPQYSFLHRPTFEAWERECLVAHGERDILRVHGLPLFFVLMVYAIGSLALGSNELENAEIYYSAALDHISSVIELDSLESIQSLLCCAVYSIRSHIGASLWKISGLAMRHCVELGYHRSTERFRGNADALTKEMSKRCFWVAYDIDRVAASVLGRPVGIPDEAIDVELPLDIDDEYITVTGLLREPRNPSHEPPTNMTGAIHAIKLRQLWSKFSSQLYPASTGPQAAWDENTVERLRQELEQWRATAPDRLDFPDSRPLSVWASQEWFQLAFDHSIMLLYRHHITGLGGYGSEGQDTDANRGWDGTGGGPADNKTARIERALDECLYCSRDLCLTYRRLYQRPTIQFTWGSLHILFLGGLTYMYCLWRSPRLRATVRQTDVVSTCMACTTVLVIIAERWNLATTYRDIFEALSERTISMMCGEPGNAFLTLGGQQYGPGAAGGAYLEKPGDAVMGVDDGGLGLPTTPTVPLQNWISALDDIGIPQESEWLVQELLQGVRQFQPELITNMPNM